MSSPEQPASAPAEQPTERPTRRPARTLDVAEYVHRDPIFGTEHTAHGVVLNVGGDGAPAVVWPLAGHRVEVDPETLRPLNAADVAEL